MVFNKLNNFQKQILTSIAIGSVSSYLELSWIFKLYFACYYLIKYFKDSKYFLISILVNACDEFLNTELTEENINEMLENVVKLIITK